jgi:hypothetical protein
MRKQKETPFVEYADGSVRFNPETNEVLIYDIPINDYVSDTSFVSKNSEGIPSEESLARELIDFNLPENVEEIIIDRFNRHKRECYRRRDLINQKKSKILKSFKPII